VPMLAGQEPLRKVSNFLYMPWPRGEAGWTADGLQFRATHDAYGKRARVERSISSPATGVFAVTDRVAPRPPAKVRLHWLLADLGWRLDAAQGRVVATIDGEEYAISWQSNLKPSAVSLVRAEEGTARGWSSQRYLTPAPAVSLELLFDVNDLLEVETQFAPGEMKS